MRIGALFDAARPTHHDIYLSRKIIAAGFLMNLLSPDHKGETFSTPKAAAVSPWRHRPTLFFDRRMICSFRCS